MQMERKNNVGLKLQASSYRFRKVLRLNALCGKRFAACGLRPVANFSLTLFFLYVIFSIVGCATAPLTQPRLPPQDIPGIYHRVEKGQTLWRISKLYAIDLDELAKVNRILDAGNIEIGELIFVPYRKKVEKAPLGQPLDDFIWPLRGKVVASFGQTFNNLINKGIDIQPFGSREVVAAKAGKVVFYTDNFGYYGKTIIIDHADGFLTVYARNAQVYIKVGDSVQGGALIAKVDSGNRNATLHFEIRKGHIPQNPNFYLPR